MAAVRFPHLLSICYELPSNSKIELLAKQSFTEYPYIIYNEEGKDLFPGQIRIYSDYNSIIHYQ